MDALPDLKEKARETWAKGSYDELARNLLPAAAHLVRSAGVLSSERVLDVACGTGITAITARLAGAVVVGLDLTPELLARARSNAEAAGAEAIEWREGDAEALPFPENSFDVVLSSFGHIFAPCPEVTIAEMLRVLKSGGRIAFVTWPPELAAGSVMKVTVRYAPPPAGVPSPLLWGEPGTVRERLGEAVREVWFESGVVRFNALSPRHVWHTFSSLFGPAIRAVEAAGPERQDALRRDFTDAVAPYFRDNVFRMGYLLTRAVKSDPEHVRFEAVRRGRCAGFREAQRLSGIGKVPSAVLLSPSPANPC